MARTREFNPELVVDAALDLFRHKGYKCCSMADVVKKSGVARYGLYQAFKDKDQLYCEALKRYQKQLKDRYIKPFCGERADFESLINHFDLVLQQLENSEYQGCFAHQAAIERGDQDPQVTDILEEIFNEIKKVYRTMIENALADNQIRNMPIEDLVTYTIGIQRALIAMTKINCSLKERQDYVRCALALLKPDN